MVMRAISEKKTESVHYKIASIRTRSQSLYLRIDAFFNCFLLRNEATLKYVSSFFLAFSYNCFSHENDFTKSYSELVTDGRTD